MFKDNVTVTRDNIVNMGVNEAVADCPNTYIYGVLAVANNPILVINGDKVTVSGCNYIYMGLRLQLQVAILLIWGVSYE